jgi:hypothetical protein
MIRGQNATIDLHARTYTNGNENTLKRIRHQNDINYLIYNYVDVDTGGCKV